MTKCSPQAAEKVEELLFFMDIAGAVCDLWSKTPKSLTKVTSQAEDQRM